MFKKVTICTTNTNWTTSVNPDLSDEEIEKYFLNKYFDVGNYPVEKMEKVIKIVIE